MSKLGLTGLSAVAIVALLMGCGDEGDSGDAGQAASTETGAATAKAAFDQRAEAICRKGRDEVLQGLTDYQRENGTLNPRDIGVDAVAATFLPVLRREVEEIDRLSAPSGDETRVEDLLAERTRALDTIESKGLSSNLELANALKGSDRLMVGYGLQSCTFS